MPRVNSAQLLPVLPHIYCTMITLEQDSLIIVIYLRSHGKTNTDFLWYVVTHTDYFGLSRDFCVQFLLSGIEMHHPIFK